MAWILLAEDLARESNCMRQSLDSRNLHWLRFSGFLSARLKTTAVRHHFFFSLLRRLSSPSATLSAWPTYNLASGFEFPLSKPSGGSIKRYTPGTSSPLQAALVCTLQRRLSTETLQFESSLLPELIEEAIPIRSKRPDYRRNWPPRTRLPPK